MKKGIAKFTFQIKNIISTIYLDNPKGLAFVVFSFIILSFNLSQSDFTWYYDSRDYWRVGDMFISNGKFSLVNYNFPLRGYTFPLIIFSIKQAAIFLHFQEKIFFLVVMSLFYSASFTLIAPTLIRNIWKVKTSFLSIIFLSITTYYFHWSLFFYPLSDLLSLAFLFTSLYFVTKLRISQWRFFLFGFFLACSTIIRPSYLIAVPFLVLWVFFYLYRKGPTKYNFIVSLLFWVIGFSIAYAPQYLINKNQYNIKSPFVQTQLAYGDNLFNSQLAWGLELQKYETNIGSDYPTPQVNFFDKQGENVLVKTGLKQIVTGSFQPGISISTRTYIKLLLKYPLDFISIYIRHIFNGLDVVYNTVYVKNVFKNALMTRLINYSIWYLLIVFLVDTLKRNKLSLSELSFPIILALPAILSIPTAIEVRFMLPVFLLAYGFIAYWFIPVVMKTSRSQAIRSFQHNVIPYLLFLTFCFLLSSNTYMGLQYGQYLLGGN